MFFYLYFNNLCYIQLILYFNNLCYIQLIHTTEMKSIVLCLLALKFMISVNFYISIHPAKITDMCEHIHIYLYFSLINIFLNVPSVFSTKYFSYKPKIKL